MLSWIVFWMEKDDIGNRMALGITTILTIMFLLGSLNGNLPKVSYPKALDWYLLISFSFVFLSLIECIIVYLFTKKATSDDQKIKLKVKLFVFGRVYITVLHFSRKHAWNQKWSACFCAVIFGRTKSLSDVWCDWLVYFFIFFLQVTLSQ